MRIARLVWLAALAAAYAGVPRAAAQVAATPQSPSAGVVSPNLAEQKRLLLERILGDSPMTAQVSASSHEEAKQLLASARELYGNAKALLDAGHVAAADALLDEAIWQVARARQLVPDPTRHLIGERVRYQQLSESITALQNSYLLNVEREAQRGRGDMTAKHEFAGATALVVEAKGLAAAEMLPAANRLLDQALALMLKDFQTHLGGHTLTYARTFTDPTEAVEFERERFRSYESLVPLAVTEYRPGKDALALVDRYEKQARERRERAERLAAARDHRAAAQTFQEATDALQRALAAAGLLVPQTMGPQ